MEKSKLDTLLEINEKLAKIIVKKYNIESEKKSEFSTLPGNLKRALLREVHNKMEVLQQENKDFEKFVEKKGERPVTDAFCEYYAHIGNLEQQKNPHNPQNLFARLLKKDSHAVEQNMYKEMLDNNKMRAL